MFATSRQSLKQLISVSIVAVLSIGVIVVLQLPLLKELANKAQTDSVADLNKDLESERIRLTVLQKLPSFGFRNIIADYTFINFAPYFGDDEARAKTGYALSPEYFEVIINRDPYFLDAYRFLSSSTTLYAGMPERTVALMEKGLKSLSPQVPKNSYYIWRYKGTDELLFLGDSQAARQSFETAGKWADTYSDKDSKYISQLSYQTAQFLAKNPNSKSAQVSAWSLVLNNAFDDRVRKIAISRIQALGGKVSITPDGQLKVQPPKKD
ncbi:hypothetical protein [Aliterella atlantica]|uniref:Uncharacterized protein n=1 Tax=Aliterella atlantica CENA595 TaxID=1618023 RepID=A0A0D8ZW98_9CYAN|nr:hypothetical protein [Aliterella atlantica]KJH71511.1 hypothetical protein UH38_11965 [Aliterella atlantica CENA595]